MCHCCASQALCCCGPESCGLCCVCLPDIRQSTSTRLMYAFFLVLATLCCCAMLSTEAQEFLTYSIPHYNSTCVLLNAGHNCEKLIGYLAVYRLTFGVCVFHLVLMVVTIKIGKSHYCRASIHNGFWGLKFLVLLGFCIGSFYIPYENLFNSVWMYVGFIGASLFIILQLFYLINFTYKWQSRWVKNAKENDGQPNRCWLFALYVVGITFLVLTICSAVVLFIYYVNHDECHENRIFIIVNSALCFIILIVSALPCQHRFNNRTSFLQGSLISLYIIYLTWLALVSEPPKFIEISKNGSVFGVNASHFEEIICGPNFYASNETSILSSLKPHWNLASGYVSAIIMILMVVYGSIKISKKKKVPTATLR